MAAESLPAPAGAHSSNQSLYTVTAGRRQFTAASLEAAITAFERWRDETGVGASEIGARFPVHRDGALIGELSYNGRYWPKAAATEVPAIIAGNVNLLRFSEALARAGLVGRHDPDRGVLVIEPASSAQVIPFPGAGPSLQEAKVGMAWYNSLSCTERRHWHEIARSAVPADAWRAFQGAAP